MQLKPTGRLSRISMTKIIACIFAICFYGCANTEKEKIHTKNDSMFILSENGISKTSIVCLPESGKPAYFAAKELSAYLKRVTGGDFPVCQNIPLSGNIILTGDSERARKLGIDVKNLARDGFFLKRSGNIIVIAGRDDKNFDVGQFAKSKDGWKRWGIPECATVFGVYSFLERIAGIRWYWPGQKGECVPVRKNLYVNELNIQDEPAFLFRWAHNYGSRGTKWFEDYKKMGIDYIQVNYWVLRNRRSTKHIPLHHMPPGQQFEKRFGKMHPDWFALTKDGRRKNGANFRLCYSNKKLIEKISGDVGAFFAGLPANERGMKKWHPAVANGNYFSLLPEDNIRMSCMCDECMKGKNNSSSRTGCMSEIIWKYVADVGNANKDKFPEKKLLCLAYDSYRDLPDVNLPENVIPCHTALHTGNSSSNLAMKRILDEIKVWKSKYGKKGYLWVYSCQECLERKKLAGIPQTEPRAMGRFYREAANYIDGSFWENDWTLAYQQHIDLYIYQRITWDPNCDVKAIIEEYCRDMYGPAAEYICAILKQAEDLWTKEIVISKPEKSAAAYLDIITASNNRIWDNIYSPEKMKKLANLNLKAEKAAQGTAYEEKVKFFKEWFYSPLKNLYDKQKKLMAIRDSIPPLHVKRLKKTPVIDGHPDDDAWNNFHEKDIANLTNASYEKDAGEIEKTKLKLAWDNEYLYILFSCSEKDIKSMSSIEYPFNSVEICYSDCVEIFLDDKQKRSSYRHFIINTAGSAMSRRVIVDASQQKAKSLGGKLKTWLDRQNKIWYLEMAIKFDMYIDKPKAGDRWFSNFCRTRYPKKEEEKLQLSSWSPLIKRSFNKPELFGSIVFDDIQHTIP